MNYSRSPYFGAISIDEEDTLSLAIPSGDLLYLMFGDSEYVQFFRYESDDGNFLSFSYDTANRVCYLDDEIIGLDLEVGNSTLNFPADRAHHDCSDGHEKENRSYLDRDA